MADMEKINAINRVVDAFFKANPDVDSIKAKDLMPELMKAGVFTSNHRDGLPLRNLLRELDSKKELGLIPRLHVERKQTNRNWYFIR